MYAFALDILLYGCDLAQSNTGKAWVNELAQRTGADVAASTNLTGNASLGGDWNLEYSTGKLNICTLNDPEYQSTLASFAVTNLGDSAAPGSGTLRAAINAANALGGSNDIFFPQLQGTITLTGGELLITDNGLRIHGPGEKSLTISGNNASRVFDIAGGSNVEMTGLTISNGAVYTYSNGGSGGGIYNGGTLAIYGSTITNNSAVGSRGSGGVGGGIFNVGNMVVDGDTFSGNSASGGSGGGIFNVGILSVSNSTFTGNSATIFQVGAYGQYVGGGAGGGILNGGTLSVNSSIFSGNSAFDGGGIANSGTLSSNLNIFSGNRAQVYFRYGSSNISVYGGAGGGISNSGTMTDAISTFSNNSATSGGGIYNSGSNMLLQGTKITDNSAYSFGAGAYGMGGIGGGIDNANGTVQLKNISVYKNTAATIDRGWDLSGNFVSLGTNTIGKGGSFTGIVDGINNDRILVA